VKLSFDRSDNFEEPDFTSRNEKRYALVPTKDYKSKFDLKISA